MIYSATGHRPGKCFDYSDKIFSNLVELAELAYSEYNPSEIVSGMALGWDLAVAQAAINMKIPFTAAIPCENQEHKWPEKSQKQYQNILKHASKSVILSKTYDYQCMQRRNIWMVDNSDRIFALWNGTSGGTANCINYAKLKNKEIVNLWTIWNQNY
jgi:uncharacterized phage-like protein YoqJ